MKLEIGKKYNTKGGWIVEIIRKTENDTFEANPHWGYFYYNEDGTGAYIFSTGLWTIISEVCEQE